MRLRDRIPREKFDAIFRPVVRELGTRAVVLKLNEAARTAIPRQSKLAEVMPKLDLLIYERERPQADDVLERLWTVYFERRLSEASDKFNTLSDELNRNLDQDKLPAEEARLAAATAAIDGLAACLKEAGFAPDEVEAVFRIKAFPAVLELYLGREVRAPEAS